MRNWKICINKSRDDLHRVCCGYICVVYSLDTVHAVLCSLCSTHRWILLVFFVRCRNTTQLVVDMLGVLSVDV